MMESVPVGSVVGQLEAWDPDDFEGFSFSLAPGQGDESNGLFSIQGNSVATSGSFDFDLQSAHSIRVRVKDPRGNVFEQALSITLIEDSDGDGVSDNWELIWGFEPTVAGDVFTLDTDGDGTLDILELFQGSDRIAPTPRFAFTRNAVEDGFFEASFIRGNNSHFAVTGTGQWSTNLMDWKNSGESLNGVTVEIIESNVVPAGADEEVTMRLIPTQGAPVQLFFRLMVEPAE